jgi:hypothetical protein
MSNYLPILEKINLYLLPLLTMALKPHKRLYFQRGFHALSLMKQAV